MISIPTIARSIRVARPATLAYLCLAMVPAFVFAQAPKGAAKPDVKVKAAVLDQVAETRTFVGTVKPLRKSIVGSAAPGRVEVYLVDEGQAVKKGDEIAILRTGIIQAEVDTAAAQVKVAEAELAELENGTRPEEVEQAKARLANAQANLTFRNAKLERTKSLRGTATREELEEDTNLALQAEAVYNEARFTLELLVQGPRAERIEQMRAKLLAAKAEFTRLDEQLQRHTMRAPFDGFITAELTEVGQWVMQGDPVAEVLELEYVDIEIPVLEDYIGALQIGSPASVDVQALGGRTFSGTVAIINPQADARARTFPVKVRVKNEMEGSTVLLKAGMFARVTLSVSKPIQAVMVSKDAVVLGGATPVVFVIDIAGGKQTARAVPVKLGVSLDSRTQVIGDVQPGQLVVVTGNERLRSGMEVTPQILK